MFDKHTKTFLAVTFAAGWSLQVVASFLFLNGMTQFFTPIMMVCMFTPLLGAWAARMPMKEIGWRFVFKNNGKAWLTAWLLPAVLTAVGGVLFYVCFPKTFVSPEIAMTLMLGDNALQSMQEAGMSMSTYLAVTILSAMLYAPVVNMIFGVGEEAGWRGCLYPVLKKHLGREKGRVVGGVIWGIWHWPVMILAGYEYGSTYLGAPVVGPILFCLFTVVLGIVLDWLQERTGCIWVPALFHGAVNAVASIPLLFFHKDYAAWSVLGPAPIGIVAMVPTLLVAMLLIGKKGKAPDMVKDLRG